MTEISYSGYRFPPEIIQPAIWLWWLFAYFVVITIGKLYLSPIGVSLVSKIAPARSLIPVLTPHGSLRLDQAEDEFSLEDGLGERLESASREVPGTAFCNSALARPEPACHRLSHGGVISPYASSLISAL